VCILKVESSGLERIKENLDVPTLVVIESALLDGKVAHQHQAVRREGRSFEIDDS
jgi:hypothetical protein